MKILNVNDNGIEVGGVETYLKNLKEGLIQSGHQVKIMTSEPPLGSQAFSDYIFKGVNQKSLFRIFPYVFNIHAYNELKRVLKEFKPDIVHLHRISYHTSPSILPLLDKYIVVMTAHNNELIRSDELIKFTRKCKHSYNDICINCVVVYKYIPELIRNMLFKLFSKNIKLFITPSKYIYKTLTSKFDNVMLVYNGIQLLKYKHISNTNTALYVGRLSQEKGVSILIKAISIVVKNNPKIKLLVIGDGNEKNNLIKLTKELGLDKHITFLGKMKHKKLQMYYEQATVVIVPSLWNEPFGLVGVEAMSVGRPVIASRVGGIPEWLDDGKTGFLVDPCNSEQIAEKVIKLFSDRKLIELMGKNARKKAEQFSMDKHVIKIESIYKDVIQKYKAK